MRRPGCFSNALHCNVGDKGQRVNLGSPECLSIGQILHETLHGLGWSFSIVSTKWLNLFRGSARAVKTGQGPLCFHSDGKCGACQPEKLQKGVGWQAEWKGDTVRSPEHHDLWAQGLWHPGQYYRGEEDNNTTFRPKCWDQVLCTNKQQMIIYVAIRGAAHKTDLSLVDKIELAKTYQNMTGKQIWARIVKWVFSDHICITMDTLWQYSNYLESLHLQQTNGKCYC